MAPTIGPTVGGYLTNLMSWHWLFLINVVPGIAVTAATIFLIDFDKPDFKLLRKFDYVGLVTLAAFLGGLEYVLEEGPRNDWFSDGTIFNFAVVSAIGCVLFFWRAFTAEEPVVDLRTFTDRNFATGSLFSFAIGVGLYGLVYLYPVFLARVRGYDSLQIGETMFVTGIFQMMTAPFAGQLAYRFDARWIVGFGMALLGVSCLELVPVTKDWAFAELFIPQAMRGVALMLVMVPISMLALGTLPPQLVKNASGLFNLTRNLGGAVGLALITTLLNERTDLHIVRLHEAVGWGREAAVERLQTMTQAFTPRLGSDSELSAIKMLTRMAHRESLVMAFSDVFLALAVVFIAMVVLVPLIRKPVPRGAAPAGGGH
jgi:DHA2 family multidrug resistance protein